MKVFYNEKENLILDAASKLIIHHGYDKTSVAEIAKEAGIGKGTIYLYFRSKDEIVESLLMREMYRHNLIWIDLVEKDPEGGLLSRMYINQLLAMNKSEFMMAIFRKDIRIFGSYLKKENSFLRDASSTTIRKEFVQMMQEVNCIRKDLDPVVVAHIMDMIAYSLVGIGNIKSEEDIPDISSVMEGLAKMMHDSLTPPNGGDSEAGKAVLRSIVDQAKKAYSLESGESYD